MLGFVLYLISYFLLLPVTIINFFVVASEDYFMDTAVSVDIFANREFRATWNKFLKTKEGYSFGRQGETISSALGKNKRDGTLTKTGKALCFILDSLDENHCIKSIKEI